MTDFIANVLCEIAGRVFCFIVACVTVLLAMFFAATFVWACGKIFTVF